MNQSRDTRHTTDIWVREQTTWWTKWHCNHQKKHFCLVCRALPCVMLYKVLIHFGSLLIVTGFALFTTWAESMEGLCHTVTHSLYFLWACWVQGGISNPLIVLLCLWFANKCFLAGSPDSWPSSYRVCRGSAGAPSVGYSVSVFVFSHDFNGKRWMELRCR